MSIGINNNEERMSYLINDELRRIAYIECGDYEVKVVKIARKALLERYEKNIWEDKNIVLKDLIECVDIDRLTDEIKKLDTDSKKNIKKYIEVFTKLTKIEPEIQNDIRIEINEDRDKNKRRVIGRSIKNGDEWGIYLCEWNDWLGYLIDNLQLQKMGIERYVAYCIIEMTSSGFNEKIIEKEFKRIKTLKDDLEQTDSNYKIEESSNNAVNQYSKDIDIIKNLLSKKNFFGKKKKTHIKPWVRLFARKVDLMLWSGVFLNILYFIERFIPIRFIKLYQSVNDYWTSLIYNTMYAICMFLIWTFIEALLLSKWGYTPGKWLTNTKVRKPDGSKLSYKEAFNRVWRVLIFGQALNIPYVFGIAELLSYSYLKRNNVTIWDKKGGFVVSHREIEGYKILINLMIIILFVFRLYGR